MMSIFKFWLDFDIEKSTRIKHAKLLTRIGQPINYECIICSMLTILNMATESNFEVISDEFNTVGIGTCGD
jgi:hypothetical protein